MKIPLVKRGQISRESDIGRFISSVCGEKKNKVFLEIGSWNGLGSTRVFLENLAKRSDVTFLYSLESNLKFFRQAKKNNKNFKFNMNHLFLIYGNIVDIDNLYTNNLVGDESKWLEQDISDYSSAPNVYNLIPNYLDVILLDGGEFSTFFEFKKLASHLRIGGYLILDDTKTRKNKNTLEFLRQTSKYLIKEISSERNGTALIVKVSS